MAEDRLLCLRLVLMLYNQMRRRDVLVVSDLAKRLPERILKAHTGPAATQRDRTLYN
jgi:hypothetical protein